MIIKKSSGGVKMEETITKENRGRQALKSGVWYTISSISVKAILIITTPLFTRLMTTAEYGASSTFTTWFTVLNVICSLNLWYSVGRAKLDFPGKLEEYVASVMLLALLFCSILGGAAFLLLDQVTVWLEMDKALVIALIIYLLAYPAVQLTQTKFKYQYNYKGNIWITIYTTVATTVLSLIFVLLIPSHRALGKSLGAVVSSVLFAIGVWLFSFKRRYVKVKVEYWKYGLLISVPLILNSISLNILAQSDRIFITKFCGADFTGIYSLAYSYAILINIVLNAANEAWLPWFHDSLNDNLKDEIRKNVKPLIVFGCWFGVGCIAIAPEAIALLGGSAYMKGIWVVPPVTVGVVCSYIFQHYEHIELHLKKTWYISFGTIMAAGINIVLNYIFVQRYGFVAAAYTTLFCYFVLMILHHFISRYVLKLHLYDDKFMYLSVVVTCIFGIIFMALYNKPWILRWILISVISLGYLWINRKLFKSVISKFASRKR